MKPSFIVIGGVKCASSSLYRYLNYHPQVLPCKTKEPRYFNSRNPLRLLWKYKSYIDLFPNLNNGEAIGNWLDLGEDAKMHPSVFSKKIEKGKKYITGEATANTHTLANPKLVKMILPNVKLILLLRNPTERFISHYNMFQRFHSEGRKGYDLGDLDEFVNREIAAYQSGQQTRIISQGMYMNELPDWKKTFGENLKIYKTNAFVGSIANNTMNDICSYLALDAYDFSPVLGTKFNSTGKKIVYTSVHEKLDAFYAPQLLRLKEEYGIEFVQEQTS